MKTWHDRLDLRWWALRFLGYPDYLRIIMFASGAYRSYSRVLWRLLKQRCCDRFRHELASFFFLSSSFFEFVIWDEQNKQGHQAWKKRVGKLFWEHLTKPRNSYFTVINIKPTLGVYVFQVNFIVFDPLVEEDVVTLRNVKLDKDIIID